MPDAPERTQPADADEGISYGRGAALLSALIGATGLLTYAFHSLAAHALGVDEYGTIATLWAAVFLTASVIYRPVEQLLSRTIAEQRARDRSIGPTLRVAATIQLALVLVFILLALLLRDQIQHRLFSDHTTLYWSFIVAVALYAASYFARGYLAGQRMFGLYGGLVLLEASSRVAVGILLVVGVSGERSVAALAIAAAPLVSLCVVPWALRGHVRRASAAAAHSDSTEGEFTLSRGVAFAGAVLLIMFSEQLILNAGVLIVRVDTRSTYLTALVFAVLMIARAPLQLFQAVATTLLPHLTRLMVREGDARYEGDFRRSVRLTVLACLGFGLATVLGVLAVGPEVMRLLFGSGFDYDRFGLALVAAGTGLYLAATTLNQAALAQGRARIAAIGWALSATFFVSFLLIGSMEVVREVEVAFIATAALLSTFLYAVYRRPVAAGEEAVRPGSTEELELRLAAADEGT